MGLIKQPVRVAANGDLVPSGAATVDGVTLVDGDRVLIGYGASPSHSTTYGGIWVVNTAGAWSRASDAATANDLKPGSIVASREGTSLGKSIFVNVSDPGTWASFGAVPQTWALAGPPTAPKYLKDPVRWIFSDGPSWPLAGLSHRGANIQDGDRVLIGFFTSAGIDPGAGIDWAVESGIWVAHAGAWTRASDADTWDKLMPGSIVPVMGAGWTLPSGENSPGTLMINRTDPASWNSSSLGVTRQVWDRTLSYGMLADTITGAPNGAATDQGDYVAGILSNFNTVQRAIAALTIPALDSVNTTGSALSGLDSTSYTPGVRAFVRSVDAYFELREGSSLTVDHLTVETAVNFPSGGQWVRLAERSAKWNARTSWYVDGQNGAASDENDGTIGTPLKTVQELARRLHEAQITGVVTVNIVSDCLSTDKAAFTYRVKPGTLGQLYFVGVPTVVRSGTFTAGTANASTASFNDDYHIEDTSLGATTWTSLGYIAKTTSTDAYLLARTNGTVAYGWLAKDKGSNQARTSAPHAAGSPLLSTWANGDTYQIRKLPRVYDMRFQIDQLASAKFEFLNISWGNAQPANLDGIDFRRCFFSPTTRLFMLAGNYENCCWTNGNSGFFGGTVAGQTSIAGASQIQAGLFVGSGASNYTICTQGSYVQFGNTLTVTFQGARMNCFGQSVVNSISVAFYDCTGDLLTVGTGARCVVTALSGNGNSAYIVNVTQGGSMCAYQTPSWASDAISSKSNAFRVVNSAGDAPFATVSGPTGSLTSPYFAGIIPA
jgi:hypothetical protein